MGAPNYEESKTTARRDKRGHLAVSCKPGLPDSYCKVGHTTTLLLVLTQSHIAVEIWKMSILNIDLQSLLSGVFCVAIHITKWDWYLAAQWVRVQTFPVVCLRIKTNIKSTSWTQRKIGEHYFKAANDGSHLCAIWLVCVVIVSLQGILVKQKLWFIISTYA